jgi:hypothetical protein
MLEDNTTLLKEREGIMMACFAFGASPVEWLKRLVPRVVRGGAGLRGAATLILPLFHRNIYCDRRFVPTGCQGPRWR